MLNISPAQPAPEFEQAAAGWTGDTPVRLGLVCTCATTRHERRVVLARDVWRLVHELDCPLGRHVADELDDDHGERAGEGGWVETDLGRPHPAPLPRPEADYSSDASPLGVVA